MHGQQNVKICIFLDYSVSNHHSKRMRSITLSCVPCLAVTCFPHYLINDTILRDEVIEYDMRFLILSTNHSETFLFLKRIRKISEMKFI